MFILFLEQNTLFIFIITYKIMSIYLITKGKKILFPKK